MTRQERYKRVIDYFKTTRPVAETELTYQDPYQLLVAVILSAQCTDKRVNMITPALFQAYPTAAHMARATAEEIFPYIKSCSYPNNKAKHLAGMAKVLVAEFGGKVPHSIDALMRLPGVGRKTANVLAAVVFHQPVMPVDTHVFRVSARLGLTRKATTPLEAEKQLTRYLPESLIPIAHHWLILHGRYVCQARKPKCDACGLRSCCLYYSKKAGRGTK